MAHAKVSQITITVSQGSCIGTFYNNGIANVMIIDNLMVKPASRSQGIGTAVMTKALALARKRHVDVVELVVNHNNHIAKKLYQKVGFTKTDKEYYRLILNKKP